MGFFFLVEKKMPEHSVPSVLALVTEKFLDAEERRKARLSHEREAPPGPYHIDNLRKLEGSFDRVPDEAREIVLRQIRQRITPYLMGESAQDPSRAMEAAIAWFQKRSTATGVPLAAKKLYEDLAAHYRSLREKNYQQYVSDLRDEQNKPIQLRLFQLEGIHLGVKKGRFILADDMGLGKSVEGLVI